MEQCGTKVDQFSALPFKEKHWNHFLGLGGPKRATNGQNDQFGPNNRSGGSKLAEQCRTMGENKSGQNRGNAMEPFHRSGMNIGVCVGTQNSLLWSH